MGTKTKTMENDVMNELIEKARIALENTNSAIGLVGNRPHYPMIVTMNDSYATEKAEAILRKLERIWRQSVDFIQMTVYKAEVETVEFYDVDSNSSMEISEFQQALERILGVRDIFAEKNIWCVYNIVDTAQMKTIGEFQQCYEMIKKVQTVGIKNTRSMLIVVLDDSMAKKTIVSEIKDYLAEKSMDGKVKEYDGVFIVSNHARNGSMLDKEELYKVLADILVLSNNDAVAQYDDDDYKERVGVFYGGVNTLSHLALERPNRKIVLQMVRTIMENLDTLEISQNLLVDEWQKKIGVENNKLAVCEQHLKHISESIDVSTLDCLPMRQPENIENVQIKGMSVAEFQQKSFEGILQEYIDMHSDSGSVSEQEIEYCIQEFEEYVRTNITAKELRLLTDKDIDEIEKRLDAGKVSTSLTVMRYIQEQINQSVRKNVLYPRCMKNLRRLKHEAEQTMETYAQVENEISRKIPVGGFEEIGTMYQTIVENYIRTPKGKKDIERVLMPGNAAADMATVLLDIIGNIIMENQATFELTFIEEWAQRLNLAGEVIYKEIHSKLDSGSVENLLLYGIYAPEIKLNIYMLHTTDANGRQETELYNHLQQAYRDVPNTQFFNTGMDDSLEAITISDVSGEKLKL